MSKFNAIAAAIDTFEAKTTKPIFNCLDCGQPTSSPTICPPCEEAEYDRESLETTMSECDNCDHTPWSCNNSCML